MKSVKVTNYPTRVDFTITNDQTGKELNAWIILGENNHTERYMNPESGEKSAAQDLEKLWEKFNKGLSILLEWKDQQGTHQKYFSKKFWELKQIKVSKPYEHNYEYIALDFGPL